MYDVTWPQNNENQKRGTYYDIIVHSEKNTAFSLCRFKDKEEGQKRFDQYKAAYTKTLLGQEFEEPDNENNLPLKTAINRKWNMVAR